MKSEERGKGRRWGGGRRSFSNIDKWTKVKGENESQTKKNLSLKHYGMLCVKEMMAQK